MKEKKLSSDSPSQISSLKSTNRFLIVALIIAAFFLGSLTNQVSSSRENKSNIAGTQDTQEPTNPNEPQQPTSAKVKEITDKDHIRGNKDAKVSLVVYSDYECPFCKSFHPTTQELLRTYGDDIRLIYRHYPLSFHVNAQKQAEASECIAELGGNDLFWKYTDTIFERTTSNGTGFALDKLGPLAAELGVDQSRFQECLDSGKYEQFVKDQIAEGTASGVNGTPATFVINDKGENELIVGAQPIDAFKSVIDKNL